MNRPAPSPQGEAALDDADAADAAQLAGWVGDRRGKASGRRRGKRTLGRRDNRPRLAEACEPLFLYACRLNRSVALGAEHDAGQVRHDLEVLLERAQRTAEAQGRDDAFARQRDALIYYADFIVGHLPASWSKEYEPLGPDGRDAFFDDHVEPVIARDPKGDHDLRGEAEVLYLCMATGFTGRLAKDRTAFNNTLGRLAKLAGVRAAGAEATSPSKGAVARVGSAATGFDLDYAAVSAANRDSSGGAAGRLCPVAYAHTDERQLSTPTGGRVWTLVLAAVLLVAAILAAGGVIYAAQAKELREAIGRHLPGADSSTSSEAVE